MFSQQIGDDGGSQKRCVQLTGFSEDSVVKGLSAGKLWSRCRRDDPEPHSQSSKSDSPDPCSGGKLGGGLAGPPSSAGEQIPNRRQKDRQSQALLTVPWSISKLTYRESTEHRAVSVCA